MVRRQPVVTAERLAAVLALEGHELRLVAEVAGAQFTAPGLVRQPIYTFMITA